MYFRLFLVTVLFFISVSAAAQDLIVSNYGDSINARILMSTKRYLFFIDKSYSGKYRIRPIKKSRVESVERNHFPKNPQDEVVFERARQTMASFGMIQGGFNFAFVPAVLQQDDPSSYKAFIHDLMTGYAYNVSLYLRRRPRTLIGIAIDNFSSSAYSSKLEFKDQGQIFTLTDVRYRISQLYVGPEMMFFRDSRAFKNFFSMSFGLGYAKFRQNLRVGFASDQLESKGGGFRFSITKSWTLTRSLLIGGNAKLLYTILGNRVDVPGPRDVQLFPFAHLDFGISLMLH